MAIYELIRGTEVEAREDCQRRMETRIKKWFEGKYPNAKIEVV
jgi:hypothetical protein